MTKFRSMKYAEIDIKTARKCCKQHSYKNKHGMTIPKCETCPLRRLTPTGTQGLCWFVLQTLYKAHKTQNLEDCDFLNAEYNALMEEDISYILEWENWINSQESLD